MSGSLDDMYRDIILDHYKAPRGKKPIDKANIESDGHNPACGDELILKVSVDGSTVRDVHVNCQGCAISVASSSMLAEQIKGKSIEEVKILAEQVRKMLKGEDVELPDDTDDLDALKGVRNFPVRIKCALLAWMTLLEGIKGFEDGNSAKAKTINLKDAD